MPGFSLPTLRPGPTLALIWLTSLTLFFIGTARTGANYGQYWDEYYVGEILARNVQSLSLFPTSHYYGGLYALPARLAIAPETWEVFQASSAEARSLVGEENLLDFEDRLVRTTSGRERLLDLIGSPGFFLRTRYVAIFFTALVIPLVFWLTCVLTGSWTAGTASATFMALSWELNTHSRLIAVDTLFMLFSPLVIAVLCRNYLRTRRIGHGELAAAAFCAGLAGGTKYTAVLLIIPVLAAACLLTPTAGQGWVRRLLTFVTLLAIALGGFLWINPGILLDPVRFQHDVAYGLWDYTRPRQDYPYEFDSRAERLWIMARYLFGTVPSPWAPAGGLLGIVSLTGLVLFARREPRLALVVLLFPVFYLVGMSNSRLQIVRNLLVLVPFVGLGFGVALTSVHTCLRNHAPGIRWAVPALGILVAGWNGYWMWHTAGTVHNRGLWSDYVREAVAHARAHPATTFRVSPLLMNDIRRLDAANLPGNLVTAPSPADKLLLYYSEENPGLWRANQPGLYKVFGTLEINFDYYPTWDGINPSRRLFLLDLAKARSLGFRTAQ